jgi:hypothetical protein
MKHDLSIFEKVPLQEIIQNDTLYSDPDTEKSDEDVYLSDEEFRKNYSFLESFKKRNPMKKKESTKKKNSKPPQPVVKEENYESD